MRPALLIVDLATAVALAIVVLMISPGLAVTATVAMVALFVCVMSFAVEGIRSRGRRDRNRAPERNGWA
ncbi:MAG: hypothetical protein JO372_04585 [Solirubrobacterales bacterium]|nr:hypothetical protein [Solirubrobacterales bacterium]